MPDATKVNELIDKVECGEPLTDDECREGGFCLQCRGFGFTYEASPGSPEELDDQIECPACKGTGVTPEHFINN